MKPVTLPIVLASSFSFCRRRAYLGTAVLTDLPVVRALAIASSAAVEARISPSAVIAFRLISASARLYSFGKTLTNFGSASPQWSRISRARRLPVHWWWSLISVLSSDFVGLLAVPDRALERLLLLGHRQHAAERDHRRVAARRELAVLVVDVGDAAAHAGGEVAPGLAEDDDGAARHVFAAVVAGAFDDRRRARQAHREALARDAAQERLAAGRAVEHGVADDDVLRRVAAEVDARPDRETAARQSLAGVVVGVADQIDRDALGEERAEALPAGAFHLDEDGVVGQPSRMAPDQLAREHRADRAIDVSDVLEQLHLLAALERRRALLDQAHVERLGEAVILRLDVAARDLGRRRRRLQEPAEVEPARLPVRDALPRVEQVDAADQLVEAAHAELGHDLRALPRRRRRRS